MFTTNKQLTWESRADGHVNRSSRVYSPATGERFHQNMQSTVEHQAKSVTDAY